MTATLALKVRILEPWESLSQKDRPWSPQSCSLEGGGEGWGTKPRQRQAKTPVRTGFVLTPTPPASPPRSSALDLVAPRGLEEKMKA